VGGCSFISLRSVFNCGSTVGFGCGVHPGGMSIIFLLYDMLPGKSTGKISLRETSLYNYTHGAIRFCDL